MTDQPRPLMIRLERVERRLAELAVVSPPDALTEPDPPSGERWEWGQVWGHLAEFPAYWVREIRKALASSSEEPPPFGRVKSDPDRIGAIEGNRKVPPPELMGRLRSQLEDLRGLLEGMTPADWARTVSHPTLGTLGMDRVMEQFLVGHLEAHADQLDSLVERS